MTRRLFVAWALSLAFSSAAGDLGGSAPSGAAGGEPSTKPDRAPPVVAAAKPGPAAQDHVIVYYFHGDRRCPTCLGMQKTIEQTIDERFGEQKAQEKLVYREVNMDEEANKHFVDHYQLASSTMIASTMKAGKEVKWVNCDAVWTHALDTEKLASYAEQQIRAALKTLEP